MKFLSLALALLLAVGTQARSLQADAPPSQLDQVRGAVLMYLDQVKESAQKALTNLDDTEYKEYKDKLSQGLDQMQGYVKGAQGSLAPYTNALAAQLGDVITNARTKITTDVDELHKQLEPRRAELKATLDKHLEEYRAKLDPLIQEYVAKHKDNMAALKARMEPIMEEMKTRVSANVEETKSVMVPMVETVRAKLTERLEELRTSLAPYAEEYKEQLAQTVGKLRETVGTGDLQASLREAVGPAAEEAKAKLMALYQSISAAFHA